MTPAMWPLAITPMSTKDSTVTQGTIGIGIQFQLIRILPLISQKKWAPIKTREKRYPPPVTHPLLGLSLGCLLVPAFMFSSLKFLHPSWIDYWLTYRHFLPISLRYTFLIYKFPKIFRWRKWNVRTEHLPNFFFSWKFFHLSGTFCSCFR